MILKYKLSCLTVIADDGALSEFESEKRGSPEALADPASDLWDMDLGF